MFPTFPGAPTSYSLPVVLRSMYMGASGTAALGAPQVTFRSRIPVTGNEKSKGQNAATHGIERLFEGPASLHYRFGSMKFGTGAG